MSEDNSEVMLELMKRKSQWNDRKREIEIRRRKLIANEEKNVVKWNLDINAAVTKAIRIRETDVKCDEIDVTIGILSNAISIIISDFNQSYCEEGEFVDMHEPRSLNQIYNCVVHISNQFNDIQRDGSSDKASIVNNLEYVDLILNKAMNVFHNLIEKCHIILKNEESNSQKNKCGVERLSQMNNDIHRQESRSICKTARRQSDEQSVKTNLEESNRSSNHGGEYINIPPMLNNLGNFNNDVNTELRSDDNYKGPNLNRNSENVEEIFRDIFMFDKAYCHNIRKMVNNICGQITSANPQHTNSRLHQILNFLEGKSISLVGSDNKVNIDLNHHRDALKLFWYLFYQAVLILAETQFAVNIETTVTFASVTTALFSRYPDRLNDLFLLIYDRYPTFDGRNTLSVEDDQVLVSLKGIARLISALFIALPPLGFQYCERLSVARLWSLLAFMESNEIQESVSAEAINGLLEVGGHVLLLTYKDQFLKMLLTIKEKFLSFSGLSELALILLIDDVCKRKAFEVQGYLDKQFWLSV